MNNRSRCTSELPMSERASLILGQVRPRTDLRADLIIANAPDPVFVSDLEGKILQANDAVSQLLGFRPDEVIEQSLSEFISPQETREFTAVLSEVVEKGVTRNARLNPRSASGEVIPTTLNASALRAPDGRVIGAIGILRDMRELDKARAYAESLIKNAPDPVFVSDLEGKILQANDAVSQLLGFRPDELVEQSLSKFISVEETREFTAALREVVAKGVTRNARLNPRSASGETIATTLNASALRDPEGRVIGAIGILRDMRELDKARAYAESLIKNAPDPVFVSDLEGKILQANDAVFSLLGFRPDELIEQSLLRFISPEETREFTAALREVVEKGVTRNARLNPRSASGEVIPTTLNASALARPRGARHRRHRHPPRHARTGQGQGGGRGRQPCQEPVPGQRQPRTPHPSERHHPVHRIAPGRGGRTEPGAAGPGSEQGPCGRQASARTHQRRTRPGENRVRQAGTTPGDLR